VIDRALRRRTNVTRRLHPGLLVSLLAAAAVVGCGSSASGPAGGGPVAEGPVSTTGGEVSARVARATTPAPAADLNVLSADQARLAGTLLGALGGAGTTTTLSPFSIADTLAMIDAGARGATASQLAAALQFTIPPDRLAAAFGTFQREVEALAQPDLRLSSANAVYAQRDVTFRPSFLATLARYYGAGVRVADFQGDPSAARTAINGWVSDRTHAKIPQLLSPGDIDRATRMVLVNALYLHAKWLSPFDRSATAPAPFTTPSGRVVVPTMHQTGSFGYEHRAGFDALELPYTGNRLVFDVLLPRPGGMPALLGQLKSAGPNALLSGLESARVAVSLPKLLLRSHLDLVPTLKSLGMRDAFLPSRADLSGIAGQPGDLYVGAIVHETYVNVDEAGTEAAAATAAGIQASAALAGRVVQFDVDRPFVFVIRDRRSGTVLFIGTVSRP
jgi:serpin B